MQTKWIYLHRGKLYIRGFDLMAEASSGTVPSGDWFRRGNALLSEGSFAEAVEAYDQAVRESPKDADSWNNRGLALASQSRFSDALRSFEQAGEINSSHPDAWYNRGMVLCALQRYDDAVSSFERALKINPKNAHAWHNKGVALKHLGLDAEARFAFSCTGWIGIHG
jgi:tetratricopeptide (TPR) repeat protein